MKRLVVMHLVTIFCVGAALPAHAHHSHGAIYDLCKSVTVGGRIESVQWKNPHTWFDLTLDARTTYHVEWTSLQQLTNQRLAGPAQEALMFGAASWSPVIQPRTRR